MRQHCRKITLPWSLDLSVTAFFLVSALLSPLLAGSILARISAAGPEAVAKDLKMPLIVLASLAAAVATTLMDFSLLKLVALTASALLTLVLLFVSMVFVTYPSEFSEQMP
jgi:hypothetical protein